MEKGGDVKVKDTHVACVCRYIAAGYYCMRSTYWLRVGGKIAVRRHTL